MPLTVAECSIDLSSIAPLLATGLKRQIGSQKRNSALDRISIVGPIPLYSARSPEFIQHGPKILLHLGWRGLLLSSDGEPVGYADIFEPVRGEDCPEYILRGADSASALAKAMTFAEDISKNLSGETKVGVVTFRPFFMTALWLQGEQDVYIPTRLGRGPRPALRTIPAAEYTSLLRREMDRRQQP